MTPASAANSTSVTPGTETEVEDYTVTALGEMTTKETYLAGSIALIEKAVEMQRVSHPEPGLFLTHGLILIEEAVSQVYKTRRLLDQGIVEGWIAENKLLGVVPSSTSQGGAA